MTRQIILALGVVCLTLTTQAQNEADALRYSQLSLMGTARFQGVSGAFGALGGDLTTLHTNPAGMGVYRRSDSGFSIGFGSGETAAEYEGNYEYARNGFGNLANAGMVASYPVASALVERINLGASFTTLAEFDERVSIEGDASNTSLLDVFANQANGVAGENLSDYFPFGAGLAWETYLIDPIPNTVNQYESVVPAGTVTQNKQITRSGSMKETAVAVAANLGNEWYLGVSLGFPSVRFDHTAIYTETVKNPGTNTLSTWQMDERLQVNGGGFNMKAGVIYRPTEYLRVGASVHTPTWLSLYDRYTTEMESEFTNGDSFWWDSPNGEYNYRVRTPARAQISAAALLGKLGFVSAEYEFVDYSTAKLRPARIGGDNYEFEAENSAIQSAYRPAHNVRIGAEAKPVKWLALRGGASLTQAPFTSAAASDVAPRVSYSAGAGVRFRGFYTDLSLAFARTNSLHYLYDPAMVDPAVLDRQIVSSVVSIGFRY